MPFKAVGCILLIWHCDRAFKNPAWRFFFLKTQSVIQKLKSIRTLLVIRAEHGIHEMSFV